MGSRTRSRKTQTRAAFDCSSCHDNSLCLCANAASRSPPFVSGPPSLSVSVWISSSGLNGRYRHGRARLSVCKGDTVP